MSFIDKSQAKGLANKIIRGFEHPVNSNEFSKLGGYKRRKQARELIKFCHKSSYLSLVGHRYAETSKWEVVWGEWSLSTSKKNSSLDDFLTNDWGNYDRIAFDVVIDLPGRQYDKFMYIILSKHALERLIMRSNIELKNSIQIRKYLDSIIKKLTLSCLALWDMERKTGLTEGYTVIRDLFIPIVMDMGINRRFQQCRAFIIKTAMPTSYNGAIKTMEEKSMLEHRQSIFEYWGLIMPAKV